MNTTRNPRIAGLAALAVILALGGCAAQSSGPTPKASVLALEASLTAAEGVAQNYVKLPRCGGAAKLCSEPATVLTVKALDTQAYDAVTAAQAAVDKDPTASASTTSAAIADATAALAGLTAVTSKLPTTGVSP